jgi:hypothetical protein
MYLRMVSTEPGAAHWMPISDWLELQGKKATSKRTTTPKGTEKHLRAHSDYLRSEVWAGHDRLGLVADHLLTQNQEIAYLALPPLEFGLVGMYELDSQLHRSLIVVGVIASNRRTRTTFYVLYKMTSAYLSQAFLTSTHSIAPPEHAARSET